MIQTSFGELRALLHSPDPDFEAVAQLIEDEAAWDYTVSILGQRWLRWCLVTAMLEHQEQPYLPTGYAKAYSPYPYNLMEEDQGSLLTPLLFTHGQLDELLTQFAASLWDLDYLQNDSEQLSPSQLVALAIYSKARNSADGAERWGNLHYTELAQYERRYRQTNWAALHEALWRWVDLGV